MLVPSDAIFPKLPPPKLPPAKFTPRRNYFSVFAPMSLSHRHLLYSEPPRVLFRRQNAHADCYGATLFFTGLLHTDAAVFRSSSLFLLAPWLCFSRPLCSFRPLMPVIIAPLKQHARRSFLPFRRLDLFFVPSMAFSPIRLWASPAILRLTHGTPRAPYPPGRMVILFFHWSLSLSLRRLHNWQGQRFFSGHTSILPRSQSSLFLPPNPAPQEVVKAWGVLINPSRHFPKR